MANPASVHCEELGGKLEIRNTEEGQTGVCVYFDGSECEEWALYRGECELGFDFPDDPDVIPNEASDFCRRQGYEFWVGTDEEGQYGYECGVHLETIKKPAGARRTQEPPQEGERKLNTTRGPRSCQAPRGQ